MYLKTIAIFLNSCIAGFLPGHHLLSKISYQEELVNIYFPTSPNPV